MLINSAETAPDRCKQLMVYSTCPTDAELLLGVVKFCV